ncbi:sigma-70 family RNA polymerase sigma factor [Myxococcota bacterium]|nr:sigma-70 family RNA polymerase sigma factor [Myxococcota bacterium]
MSSPSDSPLPDTDLLRLARQGDSAAAEALLIRHAPLITRFARAMCTRREDAEDVAQESLITAARAFGDLRTDHVESWLFAVTRSFCGKTRRRRKGQPAETEPLEAEALATPERGPEQALAARELGLVLDRAVRSLEPDKRAVLVLRDMEGLPASKVAAMLGLEVGAVKSRLHRARVAVRNQVGPEVDQLESGLVGCRPRDLPPADLVEQVRTAVRAAGGEGRRRG